MIQYIFYSLLNVILYVYLGIGLVLLVTPKQLRRYSLFLSPLVGYCYCTLLGWYFYRFNFAGTDAYAWAILLPPNIFLYFAYRQIKLQSDELKQIFEKGLLGPLVIGIISFLIISYPFMSSSNGVTAMSLFNNDIIAYSSTGECLKECARLDTQGVFGQWGFRIWADEQVFGAFFAPAFSSSLLGLETYQVQNMICVIFFVFSVLLVYILARELFRYKYVPALAIAALFGLSPIMFYTIYNGFLSQVIATGLSLGLFLINVHAFGHCKKFSEYFSYITLAIIFNWGLSITYPHVLFFIYFIILLYLFVICVFNKSIILALQGVSFVFTSLALTGFLSLYRAKEVMLQLLRMGKVVAGWHVPWFSLDGIFGIFISGQPLGPNTKFISMILSVILFVVLSLGFFKAYKEERYYFYFVGSGLFVVIMGYILLSYQGRTPTEWGGYKSYKFLSFFLPIILLSSLILFRKIELISRNRMRYFFQVFFILLIGGNFFSSSLLAHKMSNTSLQVTKKMADLKKNENLPLLASINILGESWWDIMWATNFLLRKKLYRETPTYYPASKLEGEWDLVRRSANNFNPLESNTEKTILLNSDYMLCKASPIQQIIDSILLDSEFKAELSLISETSLGTVQNMKDFNFQIKIKNMSSVTWQKENVLTRKYPIRLAYHWLSKKGDLIVFDGRRTAFPQDLGPGEEVVLNAAIIAPTEPGEYLLELDLVQENVAWFKDKGSKTIQIPVNVEL